MYATFIFSFTELTTSISQAGGLFAYARRAFGPFGGYFGRRSRFSADHGRAGGVELLVTLLAIGELLVFMGVVSPGFLAKLHTRFRTPHHAILAGGLVGIAAI